MNIPLSWLKDFVEVNLPLEEIARVMTMAGLEVDEVRLLGLAAPDNDRHGSTQIGRASCRERV